MRDRVIVISLFMVILGGLFGCQKPSPQITSMVLEPPGEDLKQSLSGIDFKIEGTKIIRGKHQFEIFPYVEHCEVRDSDHICGVRFEVATNGNRDKRLTYGVVGNAKSKEAAFRESVNHWWAEFAIPMLVSVSDHKTDFGQSPFLFAPGHLGIRGTPPGGWFDGTGAMNRKITPTLRPLINQRPNTKTLIIKLIVSPEGVKDLGCRMDGQLSPDLFDAVSTLPWPKTSSEYILSKTFFVLHRSEP